MKRINLKDPRSTRIFLIEEVNLEEFDKFQEITFTNNDLPISSENRLRVKMMRKRE